MKPLTKDEFFDLINSTVRVHKLGRNSYIRFLAKAGLATVVGTVPSQKGHKGKNLYTFHPALLMGLGLEYPEDTAPEGAVNETDDDRGSNDGSSATPTGE